MIFKFIHRELINFVFFCILSVTFHFVFIILIYSYSLRKSEINHMLRMATQNTMVVKFDKTLEKESENNFLPQKTSDVYTIFKKNVASSLKDKTLFNPNKKINKKSNFITSKAIINKKTIKSQQIYKNNKINNSLHDTKHNKYVNNIISNEQNKIINNLSVDTSSNINEIDSYKIKLSQAIIDKFYDASIYKGKICNLHIRLSRHGTLISVDTCNGDVDLCEAATLATKLASIPPLPDHIYDIFKDVTFVFAPQ